MQWNAIKVFTVSVLLPRCVYSAYDWLKEISLQHNQSEVPGSGFWHMSSVCMEFFCKKFLWHHFAGKLVMTSQNHASCFLRPLVSRYKYFNKKIISQASVVWKVDCATGVFSAWAFATAEQAMSMEAHHRVCLQQNAASQSYRHDYFSRWSWRMCSWFNQMCSLQKTCNMVLSKAK